MHIDFNLSNKILGWYDNNKRILPWRVNKKSSKKLYYRVLSEFMLQQTQVKTVIPYFIKFTKEFKNLRSLSKSSEKKIIKLWEGLGYYRRARNLLKTSKIIVNKYDCRLPKTIEEIKELPGVGNYTANALLGFIYNKPTIAIDGNIRRVFSRLLNIEEKKINFNQLIEVNRKNIFNTSRNSDLIEALMEFGALICKPKNPKCEVCNLNKHCKYLNSYNKFKLNKNKMIAQKNYNIFCYLNKKKQIALTKKNKFDFLNNFYLPEIKESSSKSNISSWKFLKTYKNSISNKKLNINLYYKFSNKIPEKFKWHYIENKSEFMPSFTKKIFNQVSILF